MSDTKRSKRFTTSEFRVAFPSLFQPRAVSEGKPAKYQLIMLFPHSNAGLSELKKQFLAYAKEKFASDPTVYAAFLDAFKTKFPDMPEFVKGIRHPFKNGDDKPEWTGFPGCVYIRVSSNQKPGVVDASVSEILDADEVYGGCYGKASLNLYYYPPKDGGKPGINFGLNNFQKTRDGEPFGEFAKPEDDFEALEEATAPAAADDDLAGL